MTSLDERRKGFEADFKRKEEFAFRVTVLRNKLLGLWAAEQLGLPAGKEAEDYARSVVAADFEVPGDLDVITKVLGDLVAKGTGHGEADVRAELARAAAEAARQLEQ
jgi:hypothetical protein